MRFLQASLAAIAVFLALVVMTNTDPFSLLPRSDAAAMPEDPAVLKLPAPPADNAVSRAASGLTGILPVLPGAQAATGPAQPPAVSPRVDAALNPAAPARIRIPRIGSNSPIIPVTLASTQQIGVTDDAATVGWYGPPPGSNGVSLLAGHRDWAGVKGSFYDLSLLRPGDTFDIVTQNGQTIPFVVWQSERYPTAAAPSGEILRTGGPPSVVLVTCEGTFDTSRQDYSHRRVVLAVAQSYLQR